MATSHEAHRLGPHVVGQRVVVRRVLPGETGPSGGPAMTDLLGVCTSWGDGVCVIAPEEGEPVTIRLADIVSGKPVPPRPSVRHRVSPLRAQLHGLNLFPDLVTEPLGDWLLRSSPTATARRANSVLAFVPAGVEDAYERVVAHYDRPIAAVLPDSAEDELFRSHGWVPESHDADTLFQIASVARVRRALRGRGSGAIAPQRRFRTRNLSCPRNCARTTRRSVVQAPGSGTRRAGWRRTPTTGSASGASRWRPSTDGRGSGSR